jgi:hypothetical protein
MYYSNEYLADFDNGNVLMDGVLCPEYLSNTIKDLKGLKDKIDDLRISVSSKFAEKIGGDCTACVIS